jgi:hypothetical protein
MGGLFVANDLRMIKESIKQEIMSRIRQADEQHMELS